MITNKGVASKTKKLAMLTIIAALFVAIGTQVSAQIIFIDKFTDELPYEKHILGFGTYISYVGEMSGLEVGARYLATDPLHDEVGETPPTATLRTMETATQYNLPGVLGGQRTATLNAKNHPSYPSARTELYIGYGFKSNSASSFAGSKTLLQYGNLNPLNLNLCPIGEFRFTLSWIDHSAVDVKLTLKSGSITEFATLQMKASDVIVNGNWIPKEYSIPFATFNQVDFNDIDEISIEFSTVNTPSPYTYAMDWLVEDFYLICGGPFQGEDDLVLWHDAFDPDNDSDFQNNPQDLEPMPFWLDKANVIFPEDAAIYQEPRFPKYLTNGINNYPGVLFERNRDYISGHGWGSDDVLESVYHEEITSLDDLSTVFTQGYVPTSKLLMVLFTIPGESIDGDRQILFEAGETTSGYNIYRDGTNMCFGMWNRYERKFLKLNNAIESDKVYLASIEYDGNTKLFRGILSTQDGASVSTNVPFSGIHRDDDDQVNMPSTGIGGEVLGTRFHDYNIRTNNYSHTFNGIIGEVRLYNGAYGVLGTLQYYYDLMGKYQVVFPYPDPINFPQPKAGDWEVISQDEPINFINGTSAFVRPNPFSSKTIFGLEVGEKQFARIELFDSFGRSVALIHSGTLGKGVSEFTIDGSMLPVGVYVVRVSGESLNITEKIVLVK